jgi:4-coumarate--CoA ligase
MTIYGSKHSCPHIPTNVSLSQFLNLYNPDDVRGNKIIFEDDHAAKRLSYDELRSNASRGAWGASTFSESQGG